MIYKNKLILGTVELGLKYGLNNKLDKPNIKTAFSILDTAWENNIRTYDTAFAYGDAEDILGKWISSRKIENKVSIISKLKPHILNDYPDGTKAEDIIIYEIKKSLKRLNINTLDGYLLHTPHYIYNNHIINSLKQAKNKRLIKNFGVSIYDESEALYAANLPVDYIQIPYNIFDQRLDKTNFFKIAKKNNITIFARSPFLQGLLLINKNKIPPYLNHTKPLLKKLDTYLNKHKLSKLTATLAFTLKNKNVNYVVFGINSTKELEENLEALQNIDHLPANFYSFIKKEFLEIEKTVITPSLWKTPKK